MMKKDFASQRTAWKMLSNKKTESINQLLAAYEAPRSRQTAQENTNVIFERVCVDGEVRKKNEKSKQKRPASPLTSGVRLKRRLVEIHCGKKESKSAEARLASEKTSTDGRSQKPVNWDRDPLGVLAEDATTQFRPAIEYWIKI